MTQWLMTHDGAVRFAGSLALLATLSLLQVLIPRRGDGWHARRWLANFGLIAASTALLRLVFPLTATAFAIWLGRAGLGLFNHFPVDETMSVATTLVVLDLAIYWQHRAFHALPLLWRAHRVHHSDIAFDVSLGVRFHPFEILPSMAYKLAVIAVLGSPPVAVLAYESLLLGFSLMTHADIALPPSLDRALRTLLVTPDWHRIHHSVHRLETNSNYGNLLSVWDRLFATHVRQPRDGHRSMAIGMHEFRGDRDQRLLALLRQPFDTTSPSANPLPDNDHA